ncbi:ubinuclein-1-like isoform X1 [Juglans microcarpa x Juglans regia]|uniref:ubinuclein-1-like isoform X1 n=2 Tax=Juglans microcarpa x Juglans regia TaxID=2249226 RepID=UPI001B7DBCD3|nr:ubinuclein-1-like isoform X1 [Juglans microcarpa x Juglans regia]
MEEEKAVGVGGGESSRASSSFVKEGDRQVFTVELRPGETTIVSWKKLLKDANKVNGSTASSVPEPPANADPSLESRIDPGQPTENEDKDGPNRFSAVIEKIERLYMGKDSSDDEDLRELPDDDQYDTEDSFIDDAELDEYFEVDKSAIKHDGFFVNRGKLERINEPNALPNQQPKKRRRKDLEKGHGGNDEFHAPSKHVKKDRMAAAKIATMLMKKDSSSPSQNLAVTSENLQDVKIQNSLVAPGISSKKKPADTKMIFDPAASLKVSNGDASVSLAEVRDIDKQKTGVVQSKSLGDKLKDASGFFDALQQKYPDKSAHVQSKSLSGRPLNNVDPLELSIRPKEKNGVTELSDRNSSMDKYAMQTTKATQIRRDGSSVRPKSSLEKAIRELEKMVAESRPPAVENQEADTSAQAVKRRLPREIKLKLAKVARLAQASQGRISKELLNRLMSILGHLIQLRTLKRNLKVMISMGLSAKQEKDDRFQQIKKDVVDMIKMREPSLESKAFGQQAGASDDFQEFCPEEKGVKKKFSMDDALEDRICDLYDLFVDGLDEDAGPQIRKLYGELAELWPVGFMDNHGIKRAICRAKDRQRALYGRHKDQEKIKRKKMLARRMEETVRDEGNSIAQPQSTRERTSTETGSHGITSATRPVASSPAAVRMHSPSSNGPIMLDRMKQEKQKGTSSNPVDDTRVLSDGGMVKKKVKRKPELDLNESLLRPEKLPSQQGEERHKSLKQAAATAGLPQKSNLQSSSAPPNVEQSS